ncbi:MAG: trimethylamine methyltransferase family protein, partial [Armatimonadota bacterium]
AHNPGRAFAWNVRQIDYLIEMGEKLGIEDWFSWGAICFAHPLRFDRDTADKFARRVREGVATGLTAMPVAGATTPVTVEGFVVVSSAEHVATWITARAINADVPLSGSMWAGTVDMRTGHVSYSAFDAMFYAFAACEFIRRWCGIVIPVGGGEYCDAKAPGLYAALEKAYKAMTIAAFTGRHGSVGSGMLDEGKVLAPVQMLLERDLADGVGNFARGLDPTEDNVGLSSILEVGIGLETNHLQTQHTLEHFRSCLWLPEFIERSGWTGWKDEQAMLDRIQGRVNALLADYVKPEGREDALAEMRGIVERAARDLLG